LYGSDADTRRACELHTDNLWQSHADPDSNAYCDSNSYAYADSNTNGYSNSYAYADSNANGDSNSYAYTDSYANGDSNSYAYADSDTNGYSNCYAYTDGYANGHSDGYAYADSYANCDSDSYAYTDSNAYSDSNSYAYADSDAYCDGNSYAYADSYANCDSNGYAYTDSYANCNSNDPAASNPDAEATSDTAAASVALTEIVKARTPERNSRVHRLAHAGRASSRESVRRRKKIASYQCGRRHRRDPRRSGDGSGRIQRHFHDRAHARTRRACHRRTNPRETDAPYRSSQSWLRRASAQNSIILLHDTAFSRAADEVKALIYQAFSATIDIPTNLHHETEIHFTIRTCPP